MPELPFAGVTVVDFSRVLSGPYATSMLADLGAEVIKVEVPGRGDDARHLGPFVYGDSVYFAGLNRGKKSVEIDLKSEAGKAALAPLLETADVVVENFRPGVAAKLGIDAPTLLARRPELVYASISGYGQTGGHAGLPAYDTVVQALSGLMAATGQRDGEPTRVGESIADVSAGMFAAFGIASALYRRAATGHGGWVDVPMYDVALALQPTNFAVYEASGRAPERSGNAHPVSAPFDAYQASDGLVVIAVANDRLFGVLADALGQPELAADARFASDSQRKAHEDELRACIEAALASWTVAEAIEILGAKGIPVSEVADLKQAIESELGQARGIVRTDSRSGHRYIGHPLLFDGQRPESALPVPEVGEHNSQLQPTAQQEGEPT